MIRDKIYRKIVKITDYHGYHGKNIIIEEFYFIDFIGINRISYQSNIIICLQNENGVLYKTSRYEDNYNLHFITSPIGLKKCSISRNTIPKTNCFFHKILQYENDFFYVVEVPIENPNYEYCANIKWYDMNMVDIQFEVDKEKELRYKKLNKINENR